MSERYPEEVTVESQTKEVNDRLLRYELELDIVKRALPIIEKFEGKKITKHIETAVKKVFEADRVWLRDEYGMYQLKIVPAGMSFDSAISIILGYHSSNVVNMKNIIERNQCYLLNEGRIVKLKNGIKHIAGLVEKRDKALALFAEIAVEAEKYEMNYDFDLGK